MTSKNTLQLLKSNLFSFEAPSGNSIGKRFEKKGFAETNLTLEVPGFSSENKRASTVRGGFSSISTPSIFDDVKGLLF